MKKIADDIYKKTEGILYKYYKWKKELKDIEDKITFFQKRITEIDNRIRNTDITIVDYYKSAPIEERVQTSSNGSSFAENQMIKAITELENQQKEMQRKIYKLTYRENQITEFIYTMDRNIEMLGSKERRFIEYKYRLNYPVLQIYKIMREEFHLEQSQFYIIKNNLIRNIAYWMNLIKE